MLELTRTYNDVLVCHDNPYESIKVVQIRKCQLDIEIINIYHKYNAIPNFLQFHIKTLKDSLNYSRCQQLLLSEET